MELEHLAAFNLLVAALIVKIAVAPDKYLSKIVGAAIFSFIIVNAISLGAGVAR